MENISKETIENIRLEIAEQLTIYEDFDIELFIAFVKLAGYSLLREKVGEIFAQLQYCFHGRYNSEKEYATMLINDCYKLPELERKYFDYETYCRDLFSTICYYDKTTRAVFSHNY